MEDVLREVLVSPTTGRFYSCILASLNGDGVRIKDLLPLVSTDNGDEALVARCLHRHFRGTLNVLDFHATEISIN